jgi:hypothetical protein
MLVVSVVSKLVIVETTGMIIVRVRVRVRCPGGLVVKEYISTVQIAVTAAGGACICCVVDCGCCVCCGCCCWGSIAGEGCVGIIMVELGGGFPQPVVLDPQAGAVALDGPH